jgi:hypothetical protein
VYAGLSMSRYIEAGFSAMVLAYASHTADKRASNRGCHCPDAGIDLAALGLDICGGNTYVTCDF